VSDLLWGVPPAMPTQPSRESGVYQIRCVPTGKIYVGSAVSLRGRWYQHRRSLQRGEHANRYLQQAWNKYGEENFEFSVLEYASKKDLLAAEQVWIDKTDCTDRSKGFNISNIAGSPGNSLVQTWEGFIDPEGSEVVITNLDEFCRKHNLSRSAMWSLARGKSKLKSHRGWTHKNSVRQRDYIKTFEGFIDPEGNPIDPITNLAEFCRQHNLDNTHMIAVANGRICSHRGWTHERGRTPRNFKTYTGFVNPKGERIIIVNLDEFCRENGLHPVKMRQLKSGLIRRYKGWTWREERDHVE
jgi:group I intron endonuclease